MAVHRAEFRSGRRGDRGTVNRTLRQRRASGARSQIDPRLCHPARRCPLSARGIRRPGGKKQSPGPPDPHRSGVEPSTLTAVDPRSRAPGVKAASAIGPEGGREWRHGPRGALGEALRGMACFPCHRLVMIDPEPSQRIRRRVPGRVDRRASPTSHSARRDQ
jgi:hypothetical protein